jgi:hypothetical protein
MASIIALLDQEQKTNTKLFDDYLGTSRDVVAEAFLAEYKETPPFQRVGNTTPFIATLTNMRFMGSNALEYKTLVQEGTTYISRLIIAYTQGIQIQFDKVQKRRAEINRLQSQMLAEKKSSVTEATGKAIVDLTEKDNENGNHMEMKIFQIVDNRLNERCPSSVTAAAKKEARKCAREEINRLTSILKRHGIVTDRDASNVPYPVADPKTATNKEVTDATQVAQNNKRKRGNQRQRSGGKQGSATQDRSNNNNANDYNNANTNYQGNDNQGNGNGNGNGKRGKGKKNSGKGKGNSNSNCNSNNNGNNNGNHQNTGNNNGNGYNNGYGTAQGNTSNNQNNVIQINTLNGGNSNDNNNGNLNGQNYGQRNSQNNGKVNCNASDSNNQRNNQNNGQNNNYSSGHNNIHSNNTNINIQGNTNSQSHAQNNGLNSGQNNGSNSNNKK